MTDITASKIPSRHSLTWRMILPVPLAVIAAIALVWFALPRIIASNATESAVLDGGQIANQFKIIRGYYTEAVVNKVVKDGSMKPSVDHTGDDKAIPLPATMIHDVSALLSKQDTTINLYSVFPFPNRKDRQLDAFQREAWEFLVKNPQASFSRSEHPRRQECRACRRRRRDGSAGLRQLPQHLRGLAEERLEARRRARRARSDVDH